MPPASPTFFPTFSLTFSPTFSLTLFLRDYEFAQELVFFVSSVLGLRVLRGRYDIETMKVEVGAFYLTSKLSLDWVAIRLDVKFSCLRYLKFLPADPRLLTRPVHISDVSPSVWHGGCSGFVKSHWPYTHPFTNSDNYLPVNRLHLQAPPLCDGRYLTSRHILDA